MAAETVVVIGAGFAGLSAACTLAKRGYKVTVVDRHDQIGGRARVFERKGFKFDMGPSWYWMPEVFEDFFAGFDKKVEDFYELKRLDPPYRVFFSEQEGTLDVPDRLHELEAYFESREPGAGAKLLEFMQQARYKYQVGMADYVRRPSVSITEFLDGFKLLWESITKLDMFKSHRSHVRSFFSDSVLVQLLEWPVLFLGGAPDGVPALYSLMDHASCALGTFYPDKGMHEVPKAMAALAIELGVVIKLNVEVERIQVGSDGLAEGVLVAHQKVDGAHRAGNGDTETVCEHEQDSEQIEMIAADIIVGTGDMNWIEQRLLEPQYRRYTDRYWQSRVMSPSSLLFYLGVNKRLPNLQHHNLFFDESLDDHCVEIYTEPAWPDKPLFYACVPSITDPSTAPDGHENLFILVPLAPALEDTPQLRDKCFNLVMDRLEHRIGESVRDCLVYKRSYAHRDFEGDYHSYKGNAYGLANTLFQTAFFKPSMKSRVPNLHFAGQLTSPGPGVPPSIISGQITADVVDSCSYLRPGGRKSVLHKQGAAMLFLRFLGGILAAIADIFAMTLIEMVSGLGFISAAKCTLGNFIFVVRTFVLYYCCSCLDATSAPKTNHIPDEQLDEDSEESKLL